MRLTIFVIFLSLVGFEPVHAESECLGNKVEMIDCYAKAQSREDDRLNSTYQKVIKLATPIDSKFVEKLRASEQTWLRFRDSNCGFYDALDKTVDGFMHADCILRMTSERATELDRLMKIVAEWE